MNSRISLVGPNGVGKSTLLALISGALSPVSGTVLLSPYLKIGQYSQFFVNDLPLDKTPVEFLMSCAVVGTTAQEIRSILGRFGVPGNVHIIPLRNLSGGQKARVVLARLNLGSPHLLLLDEPTNHLDMESIDALASALKEFSGSIVFVSHDAHLISLLDCKLWVCESQGITEYPGSFEDYREELLQEYDMSEANTSMSEATHKKILPSPSFS